jgi:subtilisin family serine protease
MWMMAQKGRLSLPITNETKQFQPNTVLFKIKPQYRNLFAKIKNSPLQSISSKEVSILSLEKVFPSAPAPDQALSKTGDSLVDLSLIYRIKYSGTLSVEKVIEKISALPFFEYAEPEFIDHSELFYLPNDSMAQPNVGQYYLYRHKFPEAWDITKGDTNVVIGILDTGTELTHPDLAGNIKINYADPINGLDDDNDGYIDNYHGWDVGDNDNDPNIGSNTHGIGVQGAASAVTDNTIGMAGPGFKCKILPVKIMNVGGALSGGYNGIIYAADHGAKVINLSWGGMGAFSQTSQNVINYAVLNKDVVVVGSAGNTEIEGDFYPASYTNVLSVSGLDTQYVAARNQVIEKRTSNGSNVGVTYSFNVDISAHVGGGSTLAGANYGPFGGTSFSSPVVAGAAALVRSHYPTMKAIQVMELLRVSGSCLDSFPETWQNSKYKMGRMLDVEKALLNIYSPSVRLKKVNASSKFGSSIFSGDTVTIRLDLQNLLSKANNLEVRMIALQGATLLDSLSSVGFIDSLQTLTNVADEFKIKINNSYNGDYLDLVFFFRDPSKNYYDFQGFKLPINPNYVDLDTNNIATTIFGTGRIGYENELSSPIGKGFVHKSGSSLLYSGGLMIGLSNTKVSDCVRGGSFLGNMDFKKENGMRYLYSTNKDIEAVATFNDSLASSIIGVHVEMKAYANKRPGQQDFVVVEYKVTNRNASTTFDSLFVGIFADWDINDYSKNRGDWDEETKTLYTYDLAGPGKSGGITLLSGQAPSCFSLDNSIASTGGNINPNDDFTTLEKYTTLANGILRPKAGYSGLGTDVSQVIGAKILNLGPGQSATVAYALVAGDEIDLMLEEADLARQYFKSIKTGATPVVSNENICPSDTLDITITPSNGTLFAYYDNDEFTTPIATGSSLTLSQVHSPDTVYVVNIDSLFASAVAMFRVIEDPLKANFQIFPADTLRLDFGQLVYANNLSASFTSVEWKDGQGNTFTSANPVFQYTLPGDYTITLTANSAGGCVDSVQKHIYVKAMTSQVVSPELEAVKLYPNPVLHDNALTLETSVPIQVTILNSLGVELVQNEFTGTTTISSALWPAGYYAAKLEYQGRVKWIPLLKQ